jgi:hypothetical protein
MPQDVNVVSLSGTALDWFKLSVVVQLTIGLVLIVVLVALAVVHFWRGG